MTENKEDDERFYCPAPDCGRSFTFKDEMTKHLERRHPEYKPEEAAIAPVPVVPADPPKTLDLFTDEEEKFEPKSISKQLLYDSTMMDKPEDIVELILRNEDLTDFNTSTDVDIEDLISLQYLSLSHNHIRDLNGVGFCLSLQELTINFNRVESLGPLESLVELRKLNASNNLIREVVSLRPLRKLTVLNLFKNRLYDLDTSLKVLRDLSLVELGLERNPCMLQEEHSRYKVIRYLKIKSLDGEDVTDLDREIASDLFTIDESSLPTTGGFVGRLRSTTETEQKRELSDVYRELDQLYTENEALKKENAVYRQQVGRAVETEETEALRTEIAHLKREVANVYILLDENQDLRRRLEEPMGENELIAELSSENERLKTRVIDLEDKVIAGKRVERRPQTSAGLIRPRTSAGVRSSTLMDVEEVDDDLEQLISKNSEGLRELRKTLREMQSERDVTSLG